MLEDKRFLLFFLVPIFLIVGCSSTQEAERINTKAMISKPDDYTDELTKTIAYATQKDLIKLDQDYVLGPGDTLEITIFEWEETQESKSINVRVSASYTINLPLLGIINVKNKSVHQLKAIIEKELQRRDILLRPQISIRVTEFNSKYITVIGAVQKPGVYYIKRNVTTLLDMLGEAGGLSQKAGYLIFVIKSKKDKDTDNSVNLNNNDNIGEKESSNIVVKDNHQKLKINLFELVKLGDLKLNVVLEHGNVVYVPDAKQFSITGYVNKPGTFSIKRPTTLLDGIAMAGGLKAEDASPEYCLLKRKKGNYIQDIPVNLTDVIEKKSPNLFLKADDILIVRQTSAKYVYNQFAKFFRVSINAWDIFNDIK